MFGKLLSTTAIAGLVLATVSVTNASPSQASQAPLGQSVTVRQASRTPAMPTTMSNQPALLQEAVAARRETLNAISAIDRNKPQDAIAALERATGKLEIVLARSPALALAPVDVTTASYDVLGSLKDVENVRTAARAALDSGRLQEARRLMSSLASETVVAVSRLPLATYPDAIKRAAALLHQNKLQEAKVVLATALSTIVVDQTVIPLPLVRAEAAVEQARVLSAKANRTAAESARLRSLLAAARTDLRFGQALGYATEKDMSNLVAAVDDLDRKTGGSQHGTGLFDRLASLFDTARGTSQPRSGKTS